MGMHDLNSGFHRRCSTLGVMDDATCDGRDPDCSGCFVDRRLENKWTSIIITARFHECCAWIRKALNIKAAGYPGKGGLEARHDICISGFGSHSERPRDRLVAIHEETGFR